MSASAAEVSFLAAAATHLGFQATVTLLVYPALADSAGRCDAATWERVHGTHSRRIAPVVGVVYGALLVSGASLLLSDLTLPGAVGIAGALVALATTGVAAAPLHARLTAPDGRADPAAVRRLLQVDRVRAVGAAVGLVGALAAALA